LPEPPRGDPRASLHRKPRHGEVSEWLKEHAWKACSREIVTWVRIPPSPPRTARYLLRRVGNYETLPNVPAAPHASESISYRMPYYSQNGRLAYFAAYKDHCSFHWISAEDKRTFAKELAAQKVVGSTLQIPRGKKVPATLIRKIVRSRTKRNESRRKK
jgi:uncharacterized protein YdhG (YjbR/CyaY superfamily)